MDTKTVDKKVVPADRAACTRTDRHRELHSMLDELLACYLESTGRRLSETSALQLMEWSYGKCGNDAAPGCPPDRRHS